MLSTLRQRFVTLFWILSAIFALRWSIDPLRVEVSTLRARHESSVLESRGWISQATPRTIEVLSFGLKPFAVDWMWLKLLQNAEAPSSRLAERSLPASLVHLISQIDPAHFETYVWGSVLLSVLRSEPNEAAQLLDRGQAFVDQELSQYPTEFIDRFWSEAYFIALRQVYVSLIELNDLPRARLAAKAAAAYPNSPAFIKGLSQRMESTEGLFEVGFRVLKITAGTVSDERAKEKIRERERLLEWKKRLWELNRDFAASPYRRKRDLSGFLSSKGVPGVDPQGEPLRLSSDGSIVSSLDSQKVMGL